MKISPRVFFLLAVTIFLIADVSAQEKERKRKKHHLRHHHHRMTKTGASDTDIFAMMDEDDKAEIAENEINDNNGEIYMNPCANKHCGAGRICEVGEDGIPKCNCIPECPSEVEARRKVCSNHNETWGSDCDVYRMRCWCDEESPKCQNPTFKHLHIEYYGHCRQMPECSKEHMADFPRRMRDWLYAVMRDLAERNELTPYYTKMEQDAETNMTRKWTNAAIWKWCDLDSHPHDSSVSRHELFPIRAPLMALEHCIAPFLNKCDSNDDHQITLTEWGKCLELDPDELEEKCEEVRGDDED